MSEAKTAVPPPLVRKKRRWWVYVLAGIGCVVLLVAALVVSVILYINSLQKTYGQSQPMELVAVDTSKAAQEAFKARWKAFAVSLENTSIRTKPLELTTDDLNLALATQGRDMGRHLRLLVEEDQLKAKFSFPMGGGEKQRYLNGTADLKVELQDGFLSVQVAKAEVNSKAPPGWLFKRLQRQNLAGALEKNYDALEFFQKLDNIEVRDGRVILNPYVAE